MSLTILVPKSAAALLKRSVKPSAVTYVSGVSGCGKTAVIKKTFEKYHPFYCSLNQENPILDGNSLTDTSVIIVDDLQWISLDTQKEQILKLLKNTDLTIVLISRAAVPDWLASALSSREFVLIDESDLRLDGTMIRKMFRQADLNPASGIVEMLENEGMGNGRGIIQTIRWVGNGMTDPLQLKEKMAEVTAVSIEQDILSHWPMELVDFLDALSVVDEFTLELAELISGSSYVREYLDRCRQLGSFLHEENGIYRLLLPLLRALRNHAAKNCSPSFLNDAAYNAGLYYELHDQPLRAIEMYRKSGRNQRIRNVLIRNAAHNAGSGFYYQLRHEYLSLSDEEISASVDLMKAAAILYDLLLQPKKSSFWMQQLEDFEKNAAGMAKKEAQAALVFLKISLIHTGSKGLLSIIKSVPSLLFSKGISLP